MLKFIHKKHIHKNANTKALVIYYNMSDIILGFLLIVLVGFFIYNYLEFSFQIPANRSYTLANDANTKLPSYPISHPKR